MNKLFVAAVIAISLAACQQETFEGRQDSGNFYASVETFATGTKTALGENRSVVWSSEDRIAIFEGKDVGQAYQVLDSYVGKSSGEFAEVEGLVAEGTGDAIDGIVAVYPFNDDLTVTSEDYGDNIIEGITFPSEQKYVAGSFSDEAFPMVAVTSDKNLSFKNVGSVLKLSIKGSYSVSSITLTGNSGESLSGSVTVTLGSNGIPSVTMSDDASTSVSLVCDPAVQLNPETATDFYISIPPTEFEAGFKVTILDGESKKHGLATHKPNPAERSSILAMPESTPESLDDIERTADTFCSVDFIEGWTETRFGGDGTIVFVKEDEQGRMTNSLMFLPDKENILMPVYIRFDENEIPSYMSFMDTEIYIDGYTDSTVDFTLAVEDAVWSIKDVPCAELMPYSLQTKAWSDNNAIRNACAIGNLIVGAAGVAGGVVMISASGIGAAITVGTSAPISVAGIALGVMSIKGGCDSIAGSLETIFGPAEQEQSTYVKDGLMGIGMEKLSDAIENAPKNDFIKSKLPPSILKDPADLGKLGTVLYWSGFIFSSIDEEWGQTYTGPVNLAQVHQEVKVVTGRADNITKDSAELYGYVSPIATAPFGDRILTEIYIVLWKAGDENSKKNHSIFNSDGGTVSFTFINLEPDTEYCYQTIFEDINNKIYRFGEVNTFKTKGETCNIREQLIKLYNDTEGDNWTNNENWCSDKPIEEWYGIQVETDTNDDIKVNINLDRNNLIGIVDLQNTSVLESLSCDRNQITSLNVAGCTNLQYINYSNNPLEYINVSNCSNLEELDDLYSKLLSNIDIRGCTNLKSFSLSNNSLVTNIDFSGCRNIENVRLSWISQLSSLNLSGLPHLKEITCISNHSLTNLNLNYCTALEMLSCYSNSRLKILSIEGCRALIKIDCTGNQLTSLNNISGLTNLTQLECWDNSLLNLDTHGCENLKIINCRDNDLLNLDVSGCSALEKLKCQNNQLTSLDVSGCSALTELDCTDNQLTSLNVSGCSALNKLDCTDNQLTSLNVSGCSALKGLSCVGNQLTNLNVSGCSALTGLSCADNQLTSLNVSGCSALKGLDCSVNQLTSLNVSECSALTGLSCADNQLTSLNVSGCSALTELSCGRNQLTSLSVPKKYIEEISCSSNNILNLDLSGCTELVDLSFDFTLENLDVSGCTILNSFSGSAKNIVASNSGISYIWLDETVENLDLSNCKNVVSIDGIMKKGSLKTLNVSGCSALKELICQENQLTSLNASGCSALEELKCQENQLTRLNVSGCSALKELECQENQLTSLDVSGCSALNKLDCGTNQLTSLYVSGCSALKRLSCDENQLTSLDISGCIAIKYVNCINNKICQLITSEFEKLDKDGGFYFDQRYTDYRHEEHFKDGKTTCEFFYTDNGIGWWYPGEPESKHKKWH